MQRFRKSSTKWMQAYMACILATQVSLLPIAEAASGPTDNSTIQSGRGGSPQSAPNIGNVGAGSFNGAATYAVPIEVALGTGGVQPNLSLSYSSHAARGASWVGSGWNLTLGAVSRSLEDGIPEYDNTKDTFVFDGQELDNTFSNLGGRWYTQQESFLDIQTVPAGSAAATNIDAWEVRGKSGTTSRFGRRNGALAEDCVIRNPNQGNKIYSWQLCEIEDVHGNLMRVYYDTSDTGNAHLQRIEYGTSTALNRRVVFTLEGRTDHSDTYTAGFLQQMTKRLDEVDVEAIRPGTSIWELIRRYDLIYGNASYDSGRSLLREVHEYGTDADEVVPTTPFKITFGYQSNYNSSGSPVTTGWTLDGGFNWGPSFSLVDTNNGDQGVRLGDVDGDGRPDLVKVFANPATFDFANPPASSVTITADSGVYLNTGSGFSATASTAWPIPPNSPLYRPFFAMNVDGEVWSTGRSLMDITGDGRVDFVGGSFYMNNKARAPWSSGDWIGGEFYDLISWPWYTSSESGWNFSVPYGSSDGINWSLLPTIDQMVSETGKTAVSLEGEPKVITISGNTRFADLQGDGLPDMIVRGARARYAVDCLPIQGFGCIPSSYICFNEETSPDRFAFGASYVIYNSGKDTAGNVYFEYPSISTSFVPIENFNPSLPGGNCQFLFFRSTDYQPCDPTDISCHPYLFHNVSYLMSAQPDCDNNKDDDGDGNIDFGQDSGCQFSGGQTGNPFDTSEAPGHQGDQSGDWRFDGHDELGNAPIDINSDGLSDILTAYEDEGTDRRKAVLNNGNKGYTSGISGWNLPSGIDLYDVPDQQGSAVYSKDLGIRFADVNGDGRVDVVQGVAGGARNTYLNDGDVGAGDGDDGDAWVPETDWRLPSGRQFVDGNGEDRGVRLIDVDGDGMTDILQSKNGSNNVYLNDGVIPDLLQTVTNRFGGVTTLEYSPSTVFDNTGDGDSVPDLPQIMQVVTKVTTHDPRSGNDSIATFDYAGGVFDSSDEVFHTNGRFYDTNGFAGFRHVTTRNLALDGSTVLREFHTTYHQEGERRGLVEATRITGPNGGGTMACWSGSDNTYTTASLRPPWVSLPDTTTAIEYNGFSTYNAGTGQCTGGTPRRAKAVVRYDGDLEGDGPFTYGNATARIEYGEVDGAGVDVNTADNRTSQFAYTTPNTTDYVVDRISVHRVRAGSNPTAGTILREAEFYYDNGALGGQPTAGLLTKRIARLHDPTEDDPVTLFGHDAYGNRTTVTTPRAEAGEFSGVNTVTYDATFHTFPISSQNALGHTRQYFYDTSPDCASVAGADPSYPAGAGLVQEEQAPNDTAGQLPYFCFDVFGRQVLERSPAGLGQVEVEYDDSWTASPFDPVSVTERRLVRVGETHKEVAVSRVDGLGRVYETQDDGPQSTAVYITVDYDALGRQSQRSAPYFAAQTPQYSVTSYDPLDRIQQVQLPGVGRVQTIAFEHELVASEVHVTTTSTDANGIAMKRRFDPFGNVLEVTEEGVPDPGPGLPGGPYTTTYGYDLMDQLVSVEDHHENTSTVTYDLLGRRRSITDRDTGQTTFDYDLNGNLIEQASPLGAITWTYDLLDRPLTHKLGPGASPTIRWTYDGAPNGKGILHTRIDGAAGITYRVLQYDLLGRATSEEFNVDKAKHQITSTYDALGQLQTRTYPREEVCGSPDPRTVEWVRDNDGYLTAIRSEGADFASSILWDVGGRLREWTAGNGIKTEIDFDPVTLRPDELRVRASGGQLIEHLKLGFDPGDRITSIDNQLDLLPGDPFDRQFTYDGLDRLMEATGPFDANHQLATHHFHYDPIGNLTCRASTSATVCTGPEHTDITYPTPLPAPGAVRPHAADSVDGASLVYDNAGNVTDFGSHTYVYDFRGKLTSASESGNVVRLFKYDADDRVARITTPSGYAGQPINRVLMTPDLEWDQENALAKIDLSLGGNTVATLEDGYDPPRWKKQGCGGSYQCSFLPMWMFWWMRRRARRREKGGAGEERPWLPTVTLFAALFVSLTGWSGVFVSTARATPPQDITYYHGDHLGSSIVVSDEVGILSQHTYRSFGETVPDGGQNYTPEYGFTGQRFDEELEIYDYGARWYDPAFGRFLQPDALVPDPLDPQSFNPYTYVLNDPVNRIDPTGNLTITTYGGTIGGDGAFYGSGTTYDVTFNSSPVIVIPPGASYPCGVDACPLGNQEPIFIPAPPNVQSQTFEIQLPPNFELPTAPPVEERTEVFKIGPIRFLPTDVENPGHDVGLLDAVPWGRMFKWGRGAISKAIDKTFSRPSGFRKGVRDQTWEAAREKATGQVRDPVKGRFMSKDKPWDMGHKPGREFRKIQRDQAQRKLNRKQVLDEHNDPANYRPELPSSNRSHRGEDLSDVLKPKE